MADEERAFGWVLREILDESWCSASEIVGETWPAPAPWPDWRIAAPAPAGPVCPEHGVAWYMQTPEGLVEYRCASGQGCDWSELAVNEVPT